MSRNFIEACLGGEAEESEIDKYVERWHTSRTGKSIYEFLGMTIMEYGMCVEHPGALAVILEHRKQ